MFRRREKQTLIRRIREAIWPSMGWNRTYDYYRHRIFRRSTSTYQIAAGLAIGVAVSFIPLIGTHFFQAIFLAWMARTNILAAFIGTAFGNPWTFPLIFWLDYKIGTLIFGAFGREGQIALPPELTWGYLLDNPMSLFLPMVAGGYVCALLVGPLVYGMIYYPVKGMRRSYRYQRIKRLRRRRVKTTPDD